MSIGGGSPAAIPSARRLCVGNPAVPMNSPLRNTTSPIRSDWITSGSSGAVIWRSLNRLDLARIVDPGARAPVDPAIERHGHRRKAMAGGIVDMDAERRGDAAGAHWPETRRIHRAGQPRFHIS